MLLRCLPNFKAKIPSVEMHNGPVRLALPLWVNPGPAYLYNMLWVLTAKAPVEWKSYFQNEPTNQKFDWLKIEIQLSLKTTPWCETHHSFPFFISNRFYRTQNNLVLSHGYGIFMGGYHGHRPCPVLPSCGDLSRHRDNRQCDWL